MSEIENRLLRAQENAREMDCLLSDYLPFIKKQIGGMGSLPLEFDDMLSIAMLTFVNCVRQYTVGRGGFLSFYQKALKNRLIDEGRKHKKQSGNVISLFHTDQEGEEQTMDVDASLDIYRREEERRGLALEIDSFSAQLSEYDISFSQLVKISPKQTRSRAQCMMLAKAVTEKEDYVRMLTQQRRLPQTELSAAFGLSQKTVEKHRKYIVVLVLLMLGDYPGIKTFLPIYKEVTQ